MITPDLEDRINRLISLSKTHPVLPDEFIPWENEITENEVYMPHFLFSMDQTSLVKELSEEQLIQLYKYELTQVIATYAWSESIGCCVFNEILLKTTPTSTEGKYIVYMLIEEYRHQYMFAKMIDKLGTKPLPFSRGHRFLSYLFVKWMSPGSKYLIALAIEQVTDMYGKHFRKTKEVYSVLRKICELHHIEEGRHMAFQKICFEKFIENAGLMRKTKLGFYYAATIWFMRSQYIRKEFFVGIGVKDPDLYYRSSVKEYRKLYAEYCLKDSIEYAKEMGLINFITRPVWRFLLKVKI